MIVQLIFLWGSFLVSGAVFLPLFLDRWGYKLNYLACCAISIIVGPIIYALLLTGLLTMMPGNSSLFYVGAMVFATLVLWWIFHHRFNAGSREVAATTTAKHSKLELSCALVVLFILGIYGITLLYLSMVLPMTANDSLEYRYVASVVFQFKDMGFYPLLGVDEGRGFYGPWSHPPTFVSLLSWSYILLPATEDPIALKTVANYFTFASALLVFGLLKSKSLLAGTLAALILVSTPIYFSQSFTNSVDPLRIAGFFVALVSLLVYEEEWNLKDVFLTALCLSCALLTHSIGVLIFPVWIGCMILDRKRNMASRVRFSALTIPLAALLAAPFYLRNISIYGSLVSDSSPVTVANHIDYEGYFAKMRGIESTWDNYIHGLFRPLSDWNTFGVAYWIVLLSIGFLVVFRILVRNGELREVLESIKSKLLANDEILLALKVVFIYYSMVLTSVLLGMQSFVKNPRYLLTPLPLVAILSGFLLYLCYAELFERETDVES